MGGGGGVCVFGKVGTFFFMFALVATLVAEA